MLTTSKVESIRGKIRVPGDKSISHRAVMIASISKGRSIVKGFLEGEDCLSTISCFRNLGVEIEREGDRVEINGKGLLGLQEPANILDAGNSGTTMRLISGILSGQDFLSIITGDESLRNRPMARIVVPLREMGAKIQGRVRNTLAPLVIQGGSLEGIDYTLPVPSAQVKSALIFAGLYANEKTIIRETAPSRDHTERMLGFFGADIESQNGVVKVRKSELTGQSVTVPGDISSAAFFMVAAAAKPGSHLIIENVGLNPSRTGIIDILRQMGGDLEIDNIHSSGGEEIGDIIIKGKQLHGVNISKEIMPRLIDEVPILALAGAIAEGKTQITGAEELRVKESNRIGAMAEEMKKLGIKVQELPDGMIIEGSNNITGGIVESYGDHRIAMTMAICGLFANEPVKIKNSECIKVSFPAFEEKLKQVCRYI